MAPLPAVALLLIASLATAAPAEASWKLLRKDKAAALSIDTASVARTGDELRFRFRADYASPHPAFSSGAPYRSMVADAMVRCELRQIATGRMRMYSGPEAKGRLVETTPPGPAPFEMIENATSDEDLWRYLCSSKK